MYFDIHRGVYFVEGVPAGARRISTISTKLDGVFSNSQLKSLDDVKDAMVSEVKAKGGNAVIDFKYTQRSSFWRSLISLDDVRWEASGVVANIDPSFLS